MLRLFTFTVVIVLAATILPVSGQAAVPLDFTEVARPSNMEPRQEWVGELLRRITARITVEDPVQGASVSCIGFVYSSDEDNLRIVTARHCFEPIPWDRNKTKSTIVLFADGDEVTYKWFYPGQRVGDNPLLDHPNYDLAILSLAVKLRHIVPPFDAPKPPYSYEDGCWLCSAYGGKSFRRPERLQIMSMLAAGGGNPVVSTGVLISDVDGTITVLLPAAQGTSGSPVLDLHGNLVGIVVAGRVLQGTEAGWNSVLVPGHAIENLVCDTMKIAPAGSYMSTPRGCLHR